MYSGITSGRVLNGELLYTKILEVNLFANANKLTSRIFVYIYIHIYTCTLEQSGYISLFYKFGSRDSGVVACPIIRNTTDLTLLVPTGAYM